MKNSLRELKKKRNRHNLWEISHGGLFCKGFCSNEYIQGTEWERTTAAIIAPYFSPYQMGTQESYQ